MQDNKENIEVAPNTTQNKAPEEPPSKQAATTEESKKTDLLVIGGGGFSKPNSLQSNFERFRK